jgi:hypothetical protein
LVAFDLALVCRAPAAASSQIVISEKILAKIVFGFWPSALAEESQRFFCQNTLHKITPSAPQTHKQNRLESAGARAWLA